MRGSKSTWTDRKVDSCTVIAGCGQVLWCVGFQFRASSGAEIFYVAENAEYVRALKVAILSARAKAPDLIPIVVVAGPLPVSQNSFIR